MLLLKSTVRTGIGMIAQLSKMIDEAHRAGLAYRRVIDRTVGLTDLPRPATNPRSGR